MKIFPPLISIAVLLSQISSTLAVTPTQPKVKTFAQWCQQRNFLPTSTRDTIDVLLREVSTKDCRLADAKLKSLTNLELSLNGITDLKPLSSLSNLTILSLSHNKISDLKPLSGLNNLQKIYLDFNEISDLQPLSSLNNLKGLYMNFNLITDVNPLSRLNNLTELYLQVNKISDVKPLSNLRNLKELYLSGNTFSTVACALKKSEYSDVVEEESETQSLVSSIITVTIPKHKNHHGDLTFVYERDLKSLSYRDITCKELYDK